MELRTENLKLVLQSAEEVLARIRMMSPDEQAEISPDWLARVRASTSADPWTHGFAILHRTGGFVIGSCGYKGPPGPGGIVEIAYGVDPQYQGHGYATEAALALVAYAFESDEVRSVVAHTQPEPNASTRVLTKCGFRYVGEVIDPGDGLVWRWELVGDAT